MVCDSYIEHYVAFVVFVSCYRLDSLLDFVLFSLLVVGRGVLPGAYGS
jgi:hypothetical protein